MDDLVSIVYGRERGDFHQELGGVAMTTAVLCAACGLEPEEMLERELIRVLNKPPKHFMQRNEDKLKLGLD